MKMTRKEDKMKRKMETAVNNEYITMRANKIVFKVACDEARRGSSLGMS